MPGNKFHIDNVGLLYLVASGNKARLKHKFSVSPNTNPHCYVHLYFLTVQSYEVVIKWIRNGAEDEQINNSHQNKRDSQVALSLEGQDVMSSS